MPTSLTAQNYYLKTRFLCIANFYEVCEFLILSFAISQLFDLSCQFVSLQTSNQTTVLFSGAHLRQLNDKLSLAANNFVIFLLRTTTLRPSFGFMAMAYTEELLNSLQLWKVIPIWIKRLTSSNPEETNFFFDF